MDVITKELNKLIDIKLNNFLNSQRKLIANNTRASALNTYIMGEVMKRIMGDKLYKEFLKILESGRVKANYFVSRNAEDISKMYNHQRLHLIHIKRCGGNVKNVERNGSLLLITELEEQGVRFVQEVKGEILK